MKLFELKVKVFELAKVTTTKQLKQRYSELRSLDFRKKHSWETALGLLQNRKSEFETWLENPPEEYRELFAETDEAFDRFDRKLKAAENLSQEALSMADHLEELAQEYQEDAIELERRLKHSRKIAKQAERN